MKLREMQLIVRVAETGAMSAAARQLNLTPAAVSAAVKRIEDDLDMRVFERTTRSLHPTDEGAILIEGCQDMLDTWARTLDLARDPRSELGGSVHLSAPSDTSYTVLAGLVTRLSDQHPRLRLVLHVSDTVHHLHREAIDLAIRYGPLGDSGLAARKLVDSPTIAVASPAYIDQQGAPETLEGLQRHRMLTLRRASVPADSWVVEGPGGRQTVAVDSPLCGDGYLVRRWAVDGRGIALKSLVDVIDDLEAGRLVRVLPQWTGAPLAVHLVYPSRRFRPARVRAVSAAIVAAFEARVTRCAGFVDGQTGPR